MEHYILVEKWLNDIKILHFHVNWIEEARYLNQAPNLITQFHLVKTEIKMKRE